MILCITGGGRTEQFVIGELYPSMKKIHGTHRVCIAHIQYKANELFKTKRIPFLNVSFFKGWCGGNLAERIIVYLKSFTPVGKPHTLSVSPRNAVMC